MIPNIDGFIDACKHFGGMIDKEEFTDADVYYCKTTRMIMKYKISHKEDEPSEFEVTTVTRPSVNIRVIEPDIVFTKDKFAKLEIHAFDDDLEIEIDKHSISISDERDLYAREMINRY